MISKYSDHNFHHWIRLIQQTKSNPALCFPFLSIFFFCDINSLHFFFFLFFYTFGSLVSLHISLYLYQIFLSIHLLFTTTTAGIHVRHHHALLLRRLYLSLAVTLFTVTLVTITTGHLSLCLCLSLSRFSSHLSIFSSNRFCFSLQIWEGAVTKQKREVVVWQRGISG